jgi:magnesium transporter
MPPTLPIRRLAAPSQNVLSFLRKQIDNAFEPCAFAGGRGYGHATACGKGGQLVRAYGLRGGIGWNGCGNEPGRPIPRNYTSRTTSVNAIAQPPAHDLPTNLISVPKSSTYLLASPLDRRAFSTTSRNNVWGIFGAKKPQQPPTPRAYTSPLSNVMDDSGSLNSLGRHMRSANELKMRCTELDENGHVTMVSGEFKKSELTAKVHIQHRARGKKR